jgi:cytochrome c oxidase subunit 1
MVGGADHGLLRRPALLVAEDDGRMYNERQPSCRAAHLRRLQPDFRPQFILGYLGMPRRYHVYPPEFQVLNVLSSAGASILACGYALPVIYFTASLWFGRRLVRTVAGDRAWSGRRSRRRCRRTSRRRRW